MSSRSGRRSRVKRGTRGQRLAVDLVAACRHGQVGKAKKLLRKGADPNGVDRGWTPLIAASYCGHFDVVGELDSVASLVFSSMKCSRKPCFRAVDANT